MAPHLLPRRSLPLLTPALAALLAVAATASARGGPGEWTRVTDLTGRNVDEVALARTADGVLHVAWLRAAATKWDLVHSAIDSAGRLGVAPAAIVQGWSSILNPVLLAAPDGGLRVFFRGIRGSAPGDPYDGSLYTATADAGGVDWSLGARGVVKSKNVGTPAAAFGAGGAAVVAWPTSGGVYVHTGLEQSGPDTLFPTGCCSYDPNLAADGATGDVVVGWYSNANNAHGLYTAAVTPAAGPTVYVPGSARADKKSSQSLSQRMPLVARRGAPGVFVAYCAGYPTCTSVNLWRHGSPAAAPLVVARPRGARHVNAAAAPAGRLWVMWMAGNRLFATRSNRAATRFGPAVSTAAPPATRDVWKAKGEGSLGPLDLFASVTTPEGLATWHTRLLPALSLTAQPARVTKADTAIAVTLQVTDAGDPVSGATVSIAGQSETSDSSGRVRVTLAPGTSGVLAGRATLAGYVGAGATVVVVTPPPKRP